MKDIDKLIEKYFDGETSLAEERLLRDYFSQATIDDKYKVYAPMFNFFVEERKEAQPKQKPVKRFSLPIWGGVAASILLLAVVKLVLMPSDSVSAQSIVYIDGKEISDIGTINNQALISIKSISEVDEDALSSQIGILDSFIE